MDRRTFVTGTGLATLVGLAGCIGGEPEVTFESEMRKFVGTGFQPTVVVTGEATNEGNGGANELELECFLQDADDETLASRRKTLEKLAAGERQQFYYVFNVPATEIGRIEKTELVGRV
jgi:hypothetical protein